MLRRKLPLRGFLVLLLLAGEAIAGPPPVGPPPQLSRSPGAEEAFALFGTAGPTFRWAGDAGTEGVELAVYRVGPVEESAAAPLWRVTLPAGARSWTPSMERCLSPDGRFAWTLRARGRGRPGPWSSRRLLEVRTAPDAASVRQALELIETSLLASAAAAAREARSAAAPSLANPGANGLSVSVLQGIALFAANLNASGGADLVLDGSTQGLVDARFDAAGIDRSSPQPQTFTIGSSGGGGMTLRVDGAPVVTAATERDILGHLICAPGQIVRYGGAQQGWECADPP
jgi:hypothetical protein